MRDRKFLKTTLATVLVGAVLLFGFSGSLISNDTASAKSLYSSNTSELQGPANFVEIDFTYDKETGCFSVGGFSCDQIQTLLGFQPIDKNVLRVLSEFGDLHMQLTGAEANISRVDGTKLATINWDANSRNTVLELLGNYGVNLDKNAVARAEEILTLSDLNLKVRASTETSETLHVALSTLILADVARNGYLSVEGLNTGLMLNPQVVRIAEAGDIKNIIACWDKGKFITKVNGNNLPTITLSEEGLEVTDKALGLGLGDILPSLIKTRLGASLAVSGGAHADDVYCGGEN
jgi:hypothetical protein